MLTIHRYSHILQLNELQQAFGHVQSIPQISQEAYVTIRATVDTLYHNAPNGTYSGHSAINNMNGTPCIALVTDSCRLLALSFTPCQ